MGRQQYQRRLQPAAAGHDRAASHSAGTRRAGNAAAHAPAVNNPQYAGLALRRRAARADSLYHAIRRRARLRQQPQPQHAAARRQRQPAKQLWGVQPPAHQRAQPARGLYQRRIGRLAHWRGPEHCAQPVLLAAALPLRDDLQRPRPGRWRCFSQTCIFMNLPPSALVLNGVCMAKGLCMSAGDP